MDAGKRHPFRGRELYRPVQGLFTDDRRGREGDLHRGGAGRQVSDMRAKGVHLAQAAVAWLRAA